MGFFTNTWHSVTHGVSHSWNSGLDYVHHRVIDDNVNRAKRVAKTAA
jgi:hypothetical protein